MAEFIDFETCVGVSEAMLWLGVLLATIQNAAATRASLPDFESLLKPTSIFESEWQLCGEDSTHPVSGAHACVVVAPWYNTGWGGVELGQEGPHSFYSKPRIGVSVTLILGM